MAPAVSPGEDQAGELRIVSAAPNVTEICCALGLRSQIVGRTRYCTYPPGIGEVPSIGALVDTNVEMLLELRPDLILVAGHSRTMTDRFAQLNLRFESLPDTSLADIFAAIQRAGELAGKRQTAQRLCTNIRADLDVVAKRFAGAPSARVLLVIGTLSDPPSPPFVAGPGSFYDDLLHLGGHINIADTAGRPFGPLSLEFIVRADPDVIIELDGDGRARPSGAGDAVAAWQKMGPLRAVKSGRIAVLTGPEHFLAGPRVAYTFYQLCRAIAGQADE